MSRRNNPDDEATLPENDGLRPDEHVGPNESEASPERCEYRTGERVGEVSDSSFEVADELHDSFPIEPIPVIMAPDGLPDMGVDNPVDNLAVAYTYETQLCIEDDRKYVERFVSELRDWHGHNPPQSGEEYDKAVPVRPRWAPATWKEIAWAREPFTAEGEPRERREFSPQRVFEFFGEKFVRTKASNQEILVPVRPFRERCVHLKQQVFSNDNQPDPNEPNHQIVFRLCAARRSNGGAYMSLSNEGVYACDFREPYDVPSARLQASKDKKKLQSRPDLLLLPIFNTAGDAVQLENKPS